MSQATVNATVTDPGPRNEARATAARRRIVPLWSIFMLAAGVVALIGAARPLSDPDIWWHIRLGRYIVAHHALPRIETWSFTANGMPWRPTAWLSDAVIGATYNALGFRGIIALKLVFASAVLAALARALLREGDSRIAALIFTPVAITLIPFLSERPQVASYLFILWLGRECRRVLAGQRVNPVRFAALMWLWANVHGMWFVGPVFLGGAAVFSLLDEDSPGATAAVRNLAAAVGGVVAAALTPVGPRLVIQPLLVVQAAHRITEWERTVLWDPAFAGYVIVFLVLLYAWARQAERVARSEVAWVTAVFVFSLVAARDVPPATLLIAPLAARALQRLKPLSSAEARAPAWLALVVVVVGVCTVAIVGATTRSVSASEPNKVVASLVDLSGSHDVRVINDYNVGGYLVGASPYIKVGIDGRTDTYPIAFVNRYLDMLSMQGKWRATWEDLSHRGADYAVLNANSALADVVQREYRWQRVARDGQWLLLAPPAHASSSAASRP